jgi:hypothetical protein
VGFEDMDSQKKKIMFYIITLACFRRAFIKINNSGGCCYDSINYDTPWKFIYV